MMTSWRKEIQDAMGKDEKIIACTLSDKELDREFDAGYGGSEGQPFTAWSETYVYFPICYDGAEWAGRAPRNPCDIAMKHQGGE